MFIHKISLGDVGSSIWVFVHKISLGDVGNSVKGTGKTAPSTSSIKVCEIYYSKHTPLDKNEQN